MEKILSYSFESSADREDTNAEKYTLREKLFGSNDVFPVWVADMDIDTPDFVIDALKQRLQHPIFGYEEVPDSAFESQIKWMKKEHNFEFGLEDIYYSPSVVASINSAIEAFSGVGDKIIVQTPVYSPFFQAIKEHDRVVLDNPLKLSESQKYEFDFEDLKSKIDKDTKLLLLCNPHNPVGRSWKKEELEEILEICLEHNIVVFSDEIHCDLVYRPNKHIPFASLSKKAKEITVTAIGVGKTFNMAGFAMSSLVIGNKVLQDKFSKVYKKIHFAQGASLSHIAFESAYKNGKDWLEDLKIHLFNNYTLLKNLCDKYDELIKITPIEATYLAWLDCRGMNLRDKELREFFINDAKLGLNAGLSFGRAGSGFMRLNFAVTSDKMSLVIQRLENALENKYRMRYD